MTAASATADLGGRCDPKFERVAELLAASIAAGREVGASLYVNVDGEDVIDLWGGFRDREHSSRWSEDTIVNVFSASKTVTSLAVLMLADRGQVDLFAPVSRYWPEFAQNGKDKAEVRHLLSHTVGLPAWEPPFSLDLAMDVEGATARLAAQAPWWEPGTRGSYHASSFGHLNAELVRRVTGRPLGTFIAEEIAGPLGADFILGLDEAEFGRVATVYPAPEDADRPSPAAEPRSDDPLAVERAISARTRLGSFSGQKRDPLVLFNSPEWRRTAFGGSSGHANARGLGRIMSALALDGMSRGVRLLGPGTISLIFQEQFRGVDSYYMKPIRWGTGYALAPLEHKERGPLPFLRPGARTCYWYGTGGSLSIADVERRITLTYAMNQCQSGRNSLNGAYYDAVYDCLSTMYIDKDAALAHPIAPIPFEVERGRLRFFARTIGLTDPVYHDVEAARRAGHRDLPVPPTFLSNSLELELPNPLGWLAELGGDLTTTTHAEQGFLYHALAYAGDRLLLERRIVDVYTKKNRALEFVVKQTDVRRGEELLAEISFVIALRHAVP